MCWESPEESHLVTSYVKSRVRTPPILRYSYELNAGLTETPVGCNMMTGLEMHRDAWKIQENQSQ